MTQQDYTVLRGEIANLEVQQINVHYVKDIQRQKKMAGLSAVLQAATGQPGAVHSAQAASDGGDPVAGFSMTLDGQPVSGSFWRATFKNGDRVDVIGHAANGQFHAIAVADPDERILWMQPHCERGSGAKKTHLLKCGAVFALLLYAAGMLVAWFSKFPLWFMLMNVSIAAPLFLFATIGLSWGDLMAFSRKMDRVGKALGIARPAQIDLFKSTRQARKAGRPPLPMGVYYY